MILSVLLSRPRPVKRQTTEQKGQKRNKWFYHLAFRQVLTTCQETNNVQKKSTLSLLKDNLVSASGQADCNVQPLPRNGE